MKKDKIVFWTITGLFAAFIALGAIPDILMIDEAKMVAGHLGYPMYLLPFLGVAKLLGTITILVPKFKTLKEWAYAGLSIDLIGAVYSIVQVDGIKSALIPFVALIFLAVSYLFWSRQKVNYQLSSL